MSRQQLIAAQSEALRASVRDGRVGNNDWRIAPAFHGLDGVTIEYSRRFGGYDAHTTRRSLRIDRVRDGDSACHAARAAAADSQERRNE